MLLLDQLKPLFLIAVAKDPALATQYAGLAQMFDAPKAVAKQAVATRKKNAKTKAVAATAAAQAAAVTTAVTAATAPATPAQDRHGQRRRKETVESEPPHVLGGGVRRGRLGGELHPPGPPPCQATEDWFHRSHHVRSIAPGGIEPTVCDEFSARRPVHRA